MTILLGTRNGKKVWELREGLRSVGVPLGDLPSGAPEVEETGTTFRANAHLKARALSRWAGEWVLADDSGIEVDALCGAPGVRSHRWAGEPPDDARNNARLLEELRGVPPAGRGASFRCALALARSGEVVAEVEGACRGVVADAPRGANDFGYDPLFLYPPLGRSFAELSPHEKLKVSHRGEALRCLARVLPGLLRAASEAGC
ncbi:MAG: RdgB/HAM1 family non-canonical purine NTP pyrophosphatase [Planctomycetes bacterium]|nr:RdgB/HAM1 family non-canonical purine NTP pyrophosphatase [Planctomycetota bacterium]